MTAIPSYISSDEYIQEKLTEQGYEQKPTDPDQLAEYKKLQDKYRKEYYKSGYSSPQSEFQQKAVQTQAADAEAAGELSAEAQQLQQVGMQKETAFTSTNYVAPNRSVAISAKNIEAAKLDSITNPLAGNTLKVYRTPQGAKYVYTGTQLVDENNNISRSGYAVDGSDIYAEFFGATAEERATMLSVAQRLGYYEGTKPSGSAISGTGLDSQDRSAVQALFNFSTAQGRTWRAIAGLVDGGSIAVGNFGSGGGGQGPSYTYDDAAADFKQAAFATLGRAPTKDEIQSAVQAMRASKTDPSVTGAKQAAMASPGEASAFKAGSALNRIFQLMGGR